MTRHSGPKISKAAKTLANTKSNSKQKSEAVKSFGWTQTQISLTYILPNVNSLNHHREHFKWNDSLFNLEF